MRKKFLPLILALILLITPTVQSTLCLPEEPTQPTITDTTNNDSIKEYNSQVEEYNKKVDEYNSAVDEEYEEAAAQVNAANEAGQQAQADSELAYAEATAANEQAQQEADATNAQIDADNAAEEERVNIYNTSEDQKVKESEDAITKANETNTAVKEHNDQEELNEAEWNAKVDQEYADALQAEKERIEALIAENEAIRAHNEEEINRVNAAEAANQAEEERIAAENEAKEAQYLAEYQQYLTDYAQYEADYEQYEADYEQYLVDKAYEERILAATDANGNQRYDSVEAYNAYIDVYNAYVDKYNSQVEAINKVHNIDTATANVSAQKNASAEDFNIDKTYIIEEAEEKSGVSVKVKISHNFGSETYETEFEIDANDSITFLPAGAIMETFNDTGAQFFYNSSVYTGKAGYWGSAWSEFQYTSNTYEEDWNHGDTHTATYKDGKLHASDEEVLYMDYYYSFRTLYTTKDKWNYANVPVEPTEPTEPTAPIMAELETFTPATYDPADIWEEKEVTEQEVVKGTYYEKDLWDEVEVPELYTAQYQTFTPISHVIASLVEIPEIIIWENLSIPEKAAYLNYLNTLDLLPEVSIVEEEEETTEEETPTIIEYTSPIIVSEEDNEEVEIVPAVVEETVIEDEDTPQAAPENGSWALINLLCTIFSCIIAILLLIAKKKKDDDEDETMDEEKKDIRGIRRFKIYSILIGIISIIAFILTEDITLPMILIDKWTILMVILLIIEIINIFVIRHKSKEEDEDEDDE